MSTIVIRTPRSSVPALSLAITVPLAILTSLPLSYASPRSLLFSLVLISLSVVLLWADSVHSSRVVEVNSVTREVRVRFRTLTFRAESRTYAVGQFVAITSYLTYGRHARNRLELVTNELQALLLASLEPGSKKTPFWTLLAPAEAESAQAKELRPALAEQLKINDTGFLGYQATTTPL